MNIKKRCSYSILMSTSLLISLLAQPVEARALLSGGALGGDRPRVLVSTDASRLASTAEGGPFEVDDHQSLVRFLLYSDMYDVEGIVHTAAISNRGLVETINEVIDAYEKDYTNLKSWSSRYPAPESLRAVTVQGATWAPKEPSSTRSTAGSRLIVQKANNGDSRPLWILVYGKITDVAQALYDDPTIKNKIRIIGSYQNFTLRPPSEPNDDVKAIAWIQQHHPDLYFIESLETLKSTAFAYGDFTYRDSNNFMEVHCRDHGALGDHMWTFRKQDKNGNPVSYTGWLRLGDDPTLNFLLFGDLNNPTVEHWGGRFQGANDAGRPNYYRDLSPVSEAHASGRKFHKEWLDDFAKRLDRARHFNKFTNSDFEAGPIGWTFSPKAKAVWAVGPTGTNSTRAGNLTLSPESHSSIEQIISAAGGTTYTISGWVRPVSVTNTNVEIWGYWQMPGGEIGNRIGGSFAAGNGAWGYVWQQLTAPSNASSLRIAFITGPGFGEAYFDDWSLVERPLLPPTGSGTQLLSNGEFANEMRYWDGRGATTEWTFGPKGDTTRAGKLTLSPGIYPSITQLVPIIGGKTYTFTASVKPVSITGTTLKMWAYWQTPSGNITNSISANFSSGEGSWIYIWKQLTAPSNATGVRVSIETGQGTGVAFIDDVEVRGP